MKFRAWFRCWLWLITAGGLAIGGAGFNKALQQASDHRRGARGEVCEEPARMVLMHTGFAGTRMIDMLVGDPLPRIC
ncbi:hypothetical protein BH23ACT11_BH23ACT11_15460 [soil metagenome]